MYKNGSCSEAVLIDAVKLAPNSTSTQIAKMVGSSYTSTSSTLKKMCDKGLIKRNLGKSIRYKTGKMANRTWRYCPNFWFPQ